MELPEIKNMRRQIANNIISKKIVDFRLSNLKLHGGNIDDFKNKIINSRIKEITVLGEEIVFNLDSSFWLLANMQSTGFFVYVPVNNTEEFKYIRSEFIFADDSKLLFIDSRGYSYFKLLGDKEFSKEVLSIGVDPLSKKFNYSIFSNLFNRRTTSVKNFLINDDILLGIGNIYSDEICFEARVNPIKSVKQLTSAETNRIFKAITKILKKSLEYDGLDMYLPVSNKKIRFDRFLAVYGKEDENCQRCRLGIIKKEKVGSNTCFYCPNCQN